MSAMNWPDRLREYRDRYMLTQEACARLLSCSAQTWYRWERGKTRPTGLYRRELERFVRTPPPTQSPPTLDS